MDYTDGSVKARRIVFVTVGTTSFDTHVRAVDTHEVKEELSKRGYTDLVIQMGRGFNFPTESSGEGGSLNVEYFSFSSSIADNLKEASLVISHAGSGSIFETLRLGKPLIVVVNEDLMDNHQSELAKELAERKHLFYARPQTLYNIIATMNLDTLIPYKSGWTVGVLDFCWTQFFSLSVSTFKLLLFLNNRWMDIASALDMSFTFTFLTSCFMSLTL